MKKKTKYIIIISVIILIIFFIILVFVLMDFSEKKAIHNKLMSTSWTWVRDEYQSTKAVEYPGQPIPNISLLFGEKSIQFCNYEDDSTDKTDIKQNRVISCKEYKYSFDEETIVVYNDKKNEIKYIYKFNEEDQLVLIYTGDGFKLTDYYSAAMG